MKWDVFLSHASEDKAFVRRLARGLQDAGLRVWFDDFTLETGDALRRSIDKGLRDSQYGVVVLSPKFLQKKWTQLELDGLVARDDGTDKIILPVWYNISAEEVRAYSPILADRLAVLHSGSLQDTVAKLLRAIRRDRQGTVDWAPESIAAGDYSFAILPVRPFSGKVLCAGRFPVSNAEYLRFIRASYDRMPQGENYIGDDWTGPFEPLSDPEFSDPEKPVVCVDFWDALAFCRWATTTLGANVFLPNAALWDFIAAEGRQGSALRDVLYTADRSKFCPSGSAPSARALTGERDNAFGVSDIFGNVWEWCGGNYHEQRHPVFARIGWPLYLPEVRGGGFLDDLSLVNPALRSDDLKDGPRTKHADLGFRICVAVDVKYLPPGLAALLETKLSLSSDIWRTALDPSYYEEAGHL